LTDLYGKTKYDGIWIDMNEATTFANGEMAYPGPAPKEETKSRFLNAKLKDGVKVDWYGSSPN